jgi:ParB family chromosome partitioning protein
MAGQSRGLGKGLGEILRIASEPDARQIEQPTSQMNVAQLVTGRYQPRQEMDEKALKSLAESIRVHGIVQPIVVRPYAGRYEIIAGERRWRAAKLAGLEQVPVSIRNDLDDASVLAIALIENIQREDLNPVEEAQALARLVEDFSMTHQQVALAIGRSRAAVTNILRLNALPEFIKGLLIKGHLKMGHARALLPLDVERMQLLAKKAVEREWSVREVEKEVGRLLNGLQEKIAVTPAPLVQTKEFLPKMSSYKAQLRKKLGANVEFVVAKDGSTSLSIKYSEWSQLENLVQRLMQS